MYARKPMIMDARTVAASLWGRSGSSFVYGFVLKIRRASIVNAVVIPIKIAFTRNARPIVVGRKLITGLNFI